MTARRAAAGSAGGTSAGPARRRAPLIAAIVLGVGLALAPAAFGMFTAAPLGGQMIEDFRPFMRPERLGAFDRHLTTIDAAASDLTGAVLPALEDAGVLATGDLADRHPSTASFLERWPAVRSEMTAMLADMSANVDRFEAVDALPPFDLFPWFFVGPGLLAAGIAAAALRAGTGRRRRWVTALAVLGVGLIAAPAVLGMFTRAPQGARMIDDLRPLMTRAKVTAVQGHFVTLGAAEGELRTRLLPAVEAEVGDPEEVAPAATAFVAAWPAIAADMAPMVGAMGDNLDNFAAIDGLPPFWLFPWFFVAPGSLLIGLAVAAGRPVADRAGSTVTEALDADDPDRPGEDPRQPTITTGGSA